MGARSSLDHLSAWYYHVVMEDGVTVGDHIDAIDRRLTALEDLLDTARAWREEYRAAIEEHYRNLEGGNAA